MKLLRSTLVSFLLLCSFAASAQLQVQVGNDPYQLARYLVGNGVAVSNARYVGGPVSAGFFRNRGGNRLGLDSGLVLTTGKAAVLSGTASYFASGMLGLPGDPLLTSLVHMTTSDACALEFDFIPLGDTVRFRYVFSSEEYPEYVCSEYNDAFAFLLSGPGITGTVNLALVPATTIPVAINSINDGIPGPTYSGTTCANMGPGSPFTSLYVNNMTGSTTLSHNGHTKVLEAGYRVQPCQVYHIRLIIADAGVTNNLPDDAFDSAVFFEARSFSAGSMSLINLGPEANGQPFLAEGCSSGAFQVRSNVRLPAALTVPLEYRGNAVPGVDVSALPASATIPAGDSIVNIPLSAAADNLPEGVEQLRIFLGSSCPNTWADSLMIEVRDYDTLRLTPASPYIYCTEGTAVQLEAFSGYGSYQWSPAALFTNATVSNPVLAAADSLLVQVLASDGTCQHKDSLRFLRKKLLFRSQRDASCSGRADGEIHVGSTRLWSTPLQFTVDNRAWSPDSNFIALAPGAHTVYLRDASGCIDSLVVTIGQKPDPWFRASTFDVPCTGVDGQIRLVAGSGTAPYSYSINGSAFVSGTQFDRPAGTYQVRMRDVNLCPADTTVIIGVQPQPLVQLQVDAATCLQEGRLSVTSGPGMEYALNNAPFQSTQTVFPLPPGAFSLQVRNHPACVWPFTGTVPLQSDLQWTLQHFDTLCEGTSRQLQLASNALQYQWTGTDLSATTVAMPVAAPRQPILYYIQAQRGYCTKLDSVALFVRPAPLASAGADTALCQGDAGQLRGSGGVRYNWKPASAVSNPVLPSPQVRPLVTTNYWTGVTDIFGCASLNTDTVEVRVVPTVRADAGHDTIVVMGQPLQLSGRELGISGVTRYEWSPATWLSNASVANPIALPGADVRYRLQLWTPEGCTGTAQVLVKLYANADLFVPSAFTPNGDGRNDRLHVLPIGLKEFHYFRVFNRWGVLVFETHDPHLGWDGKVQGSTQDTNAFVWVAEGLDFRGQPMLRKGTVLLLR